jgi:NhaP-type Na+/H+ and K+/H+ antiporter
VLAFIARPVTVFLCLAPFKFDFREKLFVAWAGLRGAVPIVMATVPVLRAEGASVQMVEALDVFDLVFFVVVIGSIVPGSLVHRAANWLGLESRANAEPCQCDEVTETASGNVAPTGLWGRLWRAFRAEGNHAAHTPASSVSTGTDGKHGATYEIET